ncbi:VPA1269 family protein [Pseudomonas sp. FME51]|uniref:gamma-mobile-trio integrase GmtZ n=1 Tax=Pseudomonas sp. FME51 TaxID=2742609 RepID=UPI0018682348|nr:VPA1269 family protein [Pseudomonas sp. FME51]
MIKQPPFSLDKKTKNFTYDQLKQKCKELNITNSTLYRENYKSYKLPANPNRLYRDQWTSWIDFFDIPTFLTYKESLKLIKTFKFKNAKEYRSHCMRNENSGLPLSPENTYPIEWENWYVYLGKPEPYKPEYLPKQYKQWTFAILEFMKTAKGGGTKVTSICKFVRLFIMEHDKSNSPHDFLLQEKLDIRPLKKITMSFEKYEAQRRFIKASHEFLQFIIDNELTVEDEDTGEIIRIGNVRNPLDHYALSLYKTTSYKPTETTKPCLQYFYVKKTQDWIIPKDAKNFRDLKHLHKYDTDWQKVSIHQIDKNDPDCVYKIISKQAYIWCPAEWVQLFTLVKIPLRGKQIAYNDSGEADEFIADLDEKNNIVWKKNNSIFAGQTKEQSFIKKYPDGEFGIYTTTNKTNSNGSGYSIPWIPEDLTYWLIKLRKWQEKYNPIAEPTPWLNCVRTHFNQTQLKTKGSNCFLFRRFMDHEPGDVHNALAPRLAASLYNIQPSGIRLSTLEGSPAGLFNYKTKYTPHSMRVSLITAYVFEKGMPIEMMMKIVGHSSTMMTLYYCKITSQDIRKRLEDAEKIKLKNEAASIQDIIESERIDQVKNKLIGSNSEILNSFDNSTPVGNYIFRDYGICPYAASRCEDGGAKLASSSFYEQTPYGYLGTQNCLRCRHFITGPAFIGGLLAIVNEIILQANTQSGLCLDLQLQVDEINAQIRSLEKQKYIASLKKDPFLYDGQITTLERDLRSYESEYELSAKKLDMFLCDIQSSYILINKCQELLSLGVQGNIDNEISLISMQEAELKLELEEISHYQQLQEVCSNATIYKSCNATDAILPRTQMLDKMALFNDIRPSLFLLTPEQQLIAGNQINKLLTTRLKSWKQINKLVNCEIKMDELHGLESIEKSEIDIILRTATKLISNTSNPYNIID